MYMFSTLRKRGVSTLSVGITTGVLGVLFDISFAALIFSNSLSDYLSAGIGFVLFSAAAARIMVALMSSFPGTVSDLAAIPTAILSWSTGMVVRELPPTATPEELLVTVIVSIALTSFLTGLFLWTLGQLKLGNIVRLLPNSVIGGFVASSGLLLVKGAAGILIKQPIDTISLQNLVQATTLMQWLPGLLLALYLVMVTRRYDHSLVIASSLVGAIALFYGSLPLFGISLAEANTQGTYPRHSYLADNLATAELVGSVAYPLASDRQSVDVCGNGQRFNSGAVADERKGDGHGDCRRYRL